MTLDDWSEDEIDSMVEVGGNSSANAIYEAFVPEAYEKPGPDAGHEQRAKFIRLDLTYNSFSNISLRRFSGSSVRLVNLCMTQIMCWWENYLKWNLICKSSNYDNHPSCCPTFHGITSSSSH